jgi:hypothetical protein
MNPQAMFLTMSIFFFAIGFIGTQKRTTEDNQAAAFLFFGASILLYFAIR